MIPLAILTCGGTFDKVYYDALSDYSIGAPCAPDILDEAGMQDGWELIEVMRKDSLDMTDDDRQTLCTAAASCRASRLVVIHGTDTMAESAAVLADIPDKTIVLTGAMNPARFRQTDAPFNLGFAMAAALTADPGTYIAMGGRLYPHDEVKKNREQGRFESTTSTS